MRLHWRVLGAGGMMGLFNDHIRLRETLVSIGVANGETMADVGTGLRAHSEVSGIVVGNGVLIVNEHRTFRGSLDRVKNGGEFFIFHVDQGERFTRLLARRCCDGSHRVARVARAIEREDGLIFNLATIPTQSTDIIGSEHNNIAGQRRSINAHNPGVRIRRTEDTCMKHPVEFDILRIADRSADAWITHNCSPSRPGSRSELISECTGYPRYHEPDELRSSRARRTSTAMIRRREAA